MTIPSLVTALSDHDLLERLRTLVNRSNEVTADLIEHLAEVDRRKLHLVRASSLHDYCTRRLGLSDAAAYKRIAVARLAQRCADVLERIRSGRLHLSGAVTLGPHLTDDNCGELLGLAEGKSQRELERLLAVRFPKPDVAECIRKLPIKARPASALPVASGVESAALSAESATESAVSPRAPNSPAPPLFHGLTNPMEREQGNLASGPTRPTAKTAVGERLPTRPSGSPDAGRIEALSRASYAVRFTASESLHDKIREAQALISHTLPKGELAALFELALDRLIAEQKKRRFGMRPPRSSSAEKPQRSNAPSPRSSQAPTCEPTPPNLNAHSAQSALPRISAAHSTKPPAHTTAASASKCSRYVPARVKRDVAERDELCCAYVDPDGERCAERHFLEFEHRVPYARGGQSDSETLRLFCRGHNQLMARREFGSEHIQRAIETHRTRARRQHKLGP